MTGKKKARKTKTKKMKAPMPFVEMETDLSAYDDDAVYPCDDDPYRGRRRPVVVEFMALDLKVCDRCQGADARVEAAVERCRPVLESCGYDIELKTAVIENEWMAEQFRFYSSPTIRVNGIDICPSIEENTCKCCSDMSDSPVKCRMYPFNGTFYEVPPVDLVVQGIMNVVVSGQSADVLAEPYELPKNFAVFFEGVRRKAAESGEEEPCCCGGEDCC